MTLMMSSSARSRPATSNASFVAGPEVGDRSVASRSRGVRAGQTRTGPRWVHGDHWLAMLVASTMAPANSNAATTIRSMPRRATSSDWRRRCDATGDPMRPGPMLRRALMSRSGSPTQRPGSGPNCAGRRRCDLQSCPCAGVSADWPAGQRAERPLPDGPPVATSVVSSRRCAERAPRLRRQVGSSNLSGAPPRISTPTPRSWRPWPPLAHAQGAGGFALAPTACGRSGVAGP